MADSIIDTLCSAARDGEGEEIKRLISEEEGGEGGGGVDVVDMFKIPCGEDGDGQEEGTNKLCAFEELCLGGDVAMVEWVLEAISRGGSEGGGDGRVYSEEERKAIKEGCENGIAIGAMMGSVEMVKKVVEVGLGLGEEVGVDVNAGSDKSGGETPLVLACRHGNVDVARFLFEHAGCEFEHGGREKNPFLAACCGNSQGCSDVVAWWVDHVWRGGEGDVPVLLDRTCELDMQDSAHILFSKAHADHNDIVRALARAGADLPAALQIALSKGSMASRAQQNLHAAQHNLP